MCALIRCCSMGTWTDGRWRHLATLSRWERYATLCYGQPECPDLVNAWWMCAQHQGTPHSEGNKDFSRLTFLGIVPLEVPHFLAHCFPLSLVFEDGYPTCGLWLIKLHLCCARVWLHLINGWWRWGVCGENTDEDSKWASGRTQVVITSLLFLFSLEILLPVSYTPYMILSPHAPCPDPQASIAPCFLLSLCWPGASLLILLASLKDTKWASKGFKRVVQP